MYTLDMFEILFFDATYMKNTVYKMFIAYICCTVLGVLGIFSSVYGQGRQPEDTFPGVDNASILTKWAAYGEPVVSDNVEAWFEWGGELIASGVEGIYTNGVEDNETARVKATNLMKWFMNYVLGLIGLVAMGYLLYHWFLALTAGTNDEQRSKWISGIKYAAIAIVWLAVAWFIISLILFVIFTVADGAL